MRTLNLMILLALVVGSASVGPARAGSWTDTVFPVKSHNFGTVAVGAKTEFRFPIHNTLSQPIHIRSVRASCGCTTPIIETESIAPGQSGSILARFNTPTFRGKKGATLTVILDQPVYAEIRLRVDGYIRSDMVFHPGSVDMGFVNQGEKKAGTTTIYYAGRSDWQVVNTISNQPWITANVTQLERGPNRANYRIDVTLREDAPEGFFQDELIIVTNDRNMPRVPLRVTGTVQTSLTIAPQAIAFGTVEPGQALTQRLVIRGRSPFLLESITCDGWNVEFTPSDQAKVIHVVAVTFTPTQALGSQRTPVIIETGGETPVIAKAILTAEVISPQVANAP
ncbi:MAG: DUF1573 domain-containing protein [Planctomycetota bacterium]